jgi:type I restriction enzyme S subunit
MTFPCYPIYRTSGIEWLDQVPGHWRSVPIKYMALERNSLFLDGDWIESKDISSDGIRYITTGNVGEGAYKEQGAGFISEETFHALGCTEVYEGDVLVSRLNNPIGRACVVPDLGGRVVTSVDNVIFRPDSKFDKKFIVYLFSSEEYFKHTSNLARGATMQRISRGLLGNIRVVTPSFEEQTQIARFLDHETARIDALIEEQQRLIELLKEKRQAVISHAVTKGLDPTVPMKDSGVEWLGEVPAHWIISQLKFNTTEMQTGPFGSQLHAEDYIDGGIPLINPAHMVDGRIIPDFQVSVDEETWSRLSRHALKAGEIIFARRGELGRCAVVSKDQEGWLCGTGSLKASLNSRLSSEYAYLLVTSKGVVSELSLESKGSTMENLNTETLGRVRLPLPPLSEQEAILEHVHEISGQFAALINEAEDGIKLITERRSALISATVTGKIDVRGWQPPASTQAPKLEVAEAV